MQVHPRRGLPLGFMECVLTWQKLTGALFSSSEPENSPSVAETSLKITQSAAKKNQPTGTAQQSRINQYCVCGNAAITNDAIAGVQSIHTHLQR